MAAAGGISAVEQVAPSSSKIKFLCSFGGRILPRPSDGALRYAGGHTRIIAASRGVSFQELKMKMSDVFGGPVVLKYQLPDEDLDALVTVSSPEDLENMMEEYDKLAETSPDGSAKLRVFLFSPSELDTPGLNLAPDINDSEHRYVDAVNGIGDLKRKGSAASFSSAPTSDDAPAELLDCSFEGASPAISSPPVVESGAVTPAASQDLFRLPPSDHRIGRVEPTSIPDDLLTDQALPPSSGFASVPLDYLMSFQGGYNRVDDLEQRDRIQYLNTHQLGTPIIPFDLIAPIRQNSFVHPANISAIGGSIPVDSPEIYMLQSEPAPKSPAPNHSKIITHAQEIEQEQLFDVFSSQKQEKIDQISLSADPEAPYSYFDDILRQQQPPVGPPQFLLKHDHLVNIPAALTDVGQNQKVKPQVSKSDKHQGGPVSSVDQMIEKLWSNTPEVKQQMLQEQEDLLSGVSVDQANPIDFDLAFDHPIPRGSAMKPSEVNIQMLADEKDEASRSSSSVDHDPEHDHEHKAELDESSKGFGVLDDNGVRLQIIKNSDLEELRELGTGAFGTVYHGKWRGTDVAIKRINHRCFPGKPSEQDRSRVDFWNEACKLADLHHPNVVAFYGLVLDGPGGSMATVTEYMVNGSLWQALREKDKCVDERRRRLIAMDAAFGMEYLHGKNIVHFDLKSDNLLVNLRDPQRPICKVGDLGLSKVKRQTLISGGVRGTLPWMAPELLNGRSTLVSDKVDVFSFGIVMWELLTGEQPYADLHHGAIIGGIVSDTLRPPVPEQCDPEWRALMEACWSTDPSDRPSFTDIAGKLRAMAQQPRGPPSAAA